MFDSKDFEVLAPIVGIILFFVLGFMLIGRLNTRLYPPKIEKHRMSGTGNRGTEYWVSVWRLSRFHGFYDQYVFISPAKSGEIRPPCLWDEVKLFAWIMLGIYGCGLLFPALSGEIDSEWFLIWSGIVPLIFFLYCLWEWHWLIKVRKILREYLETDSQKVIFGEPYSKKEYSKPIVPQSESEAEKQK